MNFTAPLAASEFLDTFEGRSFAFTGMAALIAAHIALSPSRTTTRVQLVHLFRAKSDHLRTMLDEVIEGVFEMDSKGLISTRGSQ